MRVGFNNQSSHLEIDIDTAVVAAGAMGSPRLVNQLLNSQTGGAAGIGSWTIRSGSSAKQCLSRSVDPDAQSISGSTSANTRRGLLSHSSKCGNFYILRFLRPSLTMSNNLEIHKFKSLLGATRGMDRIRNAMSIRMFHPDILQKLPGTFYWVASELLQSLRFWCILSKSGVAAVWPTRAIGCRSTGIFPARSWLFTTKCSQRCGTCWRRSSDNIQIEIPITSDWLWSAAHHSGTVSMGMDASALVDPDLMQG